MRAISRYRLQPEPDTGEERRSTLLREGRPIGKVPGVVLEAQFEARSGDLLFVSHDIPFEEQLDILLLDPDGRLLDRVSLYGAYVTGVFRAGGIIDDATLRFRFFGGNPFELHILPKLRWRLPFSDPAGVHRENRLRKQLDLRRVA